MNDPRYAIRCWVGHHGGAWLVIRLRDLRIMTEGSVRTCLRWVDVWGTVQGDKHGRELSPRVAL